MRPKPGPNIVRAMAIVGCSISLVSCKFGHTLPTPQPTTWIITYSPANTQPYQVDFDIPGSQGGCTYATTNPAPDPLNLEVCRGDIVRWRGDSQGQQHQLVVYLPDQILNDDSGNSVPNFIGLDHQLTNPPGHVSLSAPPGSSHEWYVVLFDRQNAGSTKCDHPRIKIGH